MSEERFKVCITVGLILLKDNKVLLMKRVNTGYMDGMYALVAGHLEKDESLKQAMVREAKEEAGIELNDENLDYVCGIRRGENSQYINFYLKTDKFNGDIQNKEQEKCECMQWFNLDNLPQNMIENDRRALNNLKNNIIFEEYNFNS